MRKAKKKPVRTWAEHEAEIEEFEYRARGNDQLLADSIAGAILRIADRRTLERLKPAG